MDTTSQSYTEMPPRGERHLEPPEQAVADSASPPAINPVAQPPRASLLGLPKERLNYIITLAVVKDPDANLYALLSKQHEETSTGPPSKIRAFRSPALARSCTELEKIVLPIYYGQKTFAFCSASIAYDWIRCERRKRGEAPVRRIRIYLDPGLFNTIEYATLEFSVEEKTGMLAGPGESGYYLNMCDTCQNALVSKIEDINGRDRYYNSGEKKLAALAHELIHSPVACGLADQYLICYRRA
ncbi:hypothetical protein Q7P35_010498 [Cladosporium inversicolor]